MALMAVAGCGEQPRAAYSPTESRLSMLGLRYGIYTGQHKGKPPAKLADLSRYVAKSTRPEQLAAFGVTSADELCVSARDGKPFEMVTLERLPPPSANAQQPVVLYEAVGQNGKRLVAFLGGGVQEVDAEQFKQLVPAAK
jgi:hypothetical protein